MKDLLRTIAVLMLFFSASIFATSAKTIRFATEATYPPFEYVDESGKMQGFDIDIANALCKHMGVNCTFANQSFNSLIPSLNLGKYDALVAAISITPAREQQVSFTQSYYQPSASFVALTAKHYQLSDLTGKTIGAQEGTVFAQYLKDNYPHKVTIKLYGSIQDAFLDLVAGRVDAVIADTPIAATWLKQNDNNKKYEIVDKPLVDEKYFGSGYGIAVRKNDPALLSAFNQALTEIKKNGEYEQIKAKYFGGK